MMIVEPMRPGDEVGAPGLDHRQHAFAERAELGRRGLRIGVEPSGNIRSPAWRTRNAHSETSAPSGRPSAACSSRHDRDADACTSPDRSRPAARRRRRAARDRACSACSRTAASARILVVAAAGVDQDLLARRSAAASYAR